MSSIIQSDVTRPSNLQSNQIAKSKVYGPAYIPDEESIRNDYSLHYVATQSRPQNHVQNADFETRFSENPRLRHLLDLKQLAVNSQAHPPTFLQMDLSLDQSKQTLSEVLPIKFDVIVIDPPLREYTELYPTSFPESTSSRHWWSWEELETLPIPKLASHPGFIFLWCGSGQGNDLECARSLLTKWGYRKCEDIVWVKSNKGAAMQKQEPQDQGEGDGMKVSRLGKGIFVPTKEHCLMGIRGTVRRSTDGHFVHCNVDTDVIIAEPDPTNPLAKPEEIYNLVENFCLGSRRLELFGSKRSLRRGWVTVGSDVMPSDELKGGARPFNLAEYTASFVGSDGIERTLVESTPDIEALRPKSPPPRTGFNSQNVYVQGLSGGSPSPSSSTSPFMGSPSHHQHVPSGFNSPQFNGRNTLSHPSGGLGRGPGNSLKPGMRLSGSREPVNNGGRRINVVPQAPGRSVPPRLQMGAPMSPPIYNPSMPPNVGGHAMFPVDSGNAYGQYVGRPDPRLAGAERYAVDSANMDMVNSNVYGPCSNTLVHAPPNIGFAPMSAPQFHQAGPGPPMPAPHFHQAGPPPTMLSPQQCYQSIPQQQAFQPPFFQQQPVYNPPPYVAAPQHYPLQHPPQPQHFAQFPQYRQQGGPFGQPTFASSGTGASTGNGTAWPTQMGPGDYRSNQNQSMYYLNQGA